MALRHSNWASDSSSISFIPIGEQCTIVLPRQLWFANGPTLCCDKQKAHSAYLHRNRYCLRLRAAYSCATTWARRLTPVAVDFHEKASCCQERAVIFGGNPRDRVGRRASKGCY